MDLQQLNTRRKIKKNRFYVELIDRKEKNWTKKQKKKKQKKRMQKKRKKYIKHQTHKKKENKRNSIIFTLVHHCMLSLLLIIPRPLIFCLFCFFLFLYLPDHPFFHCLVFLLFHFHLRFDYY